MKAVIAVMTEDKPDLDAIRRAGEILKNGGLVAFPTETVYGLGGNALDPEAARKIYAAKGRPSDNPLIVHIASLESLQAIVTQIPMSALMLAGKYWPGPLTMIFHKSDLVPSETTGGLDTVAVRYPDNRIACELIRAAGGYVAAPSANLSGRPSPTQASHVAEDLGDRIDMILDGGPVTIGLESTIVDFTEEIPVILRPGFLNREMLSEVLGRVRVDPGLNSENAEVRPKAPGMRYRHYAPKADLEIVEGEAEEVIGTINDLVRKNSAEGRRTGIICTEETRNRYPEGTVRCIGSRSEEATIAHNLYDILRQFDEEEMDVIYSEAFFTPQLGQAIMNRLIKAAGHKVISAEMSPDEKQTQEPGAPWRKPENEKL